jgi:uncharacterized protein YajQ (UPF0234 family)
MASSYSFDVVCQVDLQEVTNAVDQAKREITNRYDFRGSTAEIDLDKEEPSLQLTAEDEYKLQAVTDILLTKMLKRNVQFNRDSPRSNAKVLISKSRI